MKATIVFNTPNQVSLKLLPESPDEKLKVTGLATVTSRPHTFFSRGFEYMDPEVEFLIQEISLER
jgi:hypothetical protein